MRSNCALAISGLQRAIMPGQFVTNQNRTILLARAITNRRYRKCLCHKSACRY